MPIKRSFAILVSCVCFFLSACNLPQEQAVTSSLPATETAAQVDPTPTEMAKLSENLNICLEHEPRSLFLFGDSSIEAKLVRQAIYDGPYDTLQGEYLPVLLEKIPAYADGDIFFEPVEVAPGQLLADAWGSLVKLEADVSYFPSGCQDFSCVQTYAGTGEVVVDQQVIRFILKKGVLWSDGKEVSSDDSLYSFEIAQQLYPKVGSDILPYTAAYQAVDAVTLEWRGLPGYQSGNIMRYFFQPLPRHVSEGKTLDELLTLPETTRTPIGWGPFVINEWRAGQAIVMKKNPNFFRKDEGLPKVDTMTFRILPERSEAVAALLAGECDILSPTYALEKDAQQLELLIQNPEIKLEFFDTTEWEHLDFGINSLNLEVPQLFQSKVTRQAIAMCIDRQKIIDQFDYASFAVPNSIIPDTSAFYHAGVRSYDYDPVTAAALFEAAGWIDDDGNPVTPRIAQGVVGVEDGTPFAFVLLTTTDGERQTTAQLIRENLAGCGVEVQVEAMPADQLFASGPDGKIFGRQFQMVLFSWGRGNWPKMCNLFVSQETPGEYPQFPKGWGGANLSGYSNNEYDQICSLSQRILPGTTEYQNAFALVQSVFSEDLPAIPLYFRKNVAASRSGICETLVDPDGGFSLWNIELLSITQNCVD